MAYRKLSEQVSQLSNVQRSDTFIKAFKESVRQGDITAAYLPDRFPLPKTYNRRGSDETYSKDTRDMIFEITPAFETWFGNINKELAPARSGGKVKVTTANIEAGLVDFKELAAQTRASMHTRYNRGQQLGSSRGKGAGRAKTAAPKKAGRPKKS